MYIPLSIRHFMAEFYGTFSMVFVTLSLLILEVSIPLVAFALGATYLLSAYTLKHISGAHFSPYLTLASWFDGRMRILSVALYLSAQASGALFAWLSSLLLGRIQPLAMISLPLWRAFMLEVFIVYMLVYVFLAVTKQRELRPHTPFIIGVTYGVLGLLAMKALGNTLLVWPSLMLLHQRSLLSFVAGVIGTALASVFYHFLKYQEDEKKEATHT